MTLTSLDSICKLISSGGTPSRKTSSFFADGGSGHPWVKSKELRDCAIADTEEHISDEGLNKSSAKYYPANAVLIAMYGANVGQLGWLKAPATVNQAVCALIVDDEKADWRYLFYALLLNRHDLTIQAQGAAQQNLNQDLIRQFHIDLPSLPVQRRIAGILSAYDDLIENSQRRIKILEEMARRLYREWFVHFRFPGHEDCRFADSPLGEIPEGWETKRLGDIVEDVVDYRGKTPAKLGGEWSNDGVIALSALNVKGGHLVNLEKSKRVSEELYARWMKKPLRQCDILMTSEAPLGELYFLSGQDRYCLSQRLFSIRADHRVVCPVILYFSLDSEQVQHELRSRASGSTVSGIRQSELRNLPLVVPSMGVQKKAEVVLSQLSEQIHTLNSQIQHLRRTRDLLLPRLLSGQIDVEALPEPAVAEP